MNNRIQELKNLCYNDIQEGRNAFESYIVTRFDTNKFAELIIKECADLVKDFYQEDEFTCYNAAEEIKEHFSIE